MGPGDCATVKKLCGRPASCSLRMRLVVCARHTAHHIRGLAAISCYLQVPTAEQVKHDDLTEALATFQTQLAEVGVSCCCRDRFGVLMT